MKYSSPKIIKILTKLKNDIFKDRKFPDLFKIGALVPCHKKKKPIKNPDNYRRITIASNVDKVVVKEMATHTKPESEVKQDPLWYGFTEKCSPYIYMLPPGDSSNSRSQDSQDHTVPVLYGL